ncbi:MAG: superoxide dismutase [Planctomycetota bacterium]
MALDPTDIGNATAPFALPQLPYDRKALAPHISPETLEFHHGKHHQGYVDKLNKLVGDSKWSDEQLATIVVRSDGAICQNAGQVWNHSFYWRCLDPKGGGAPDGALAKAIDTSFGSYAAFREQFKQTATGQFGSGWAWLVYCDGALETMATSNADGPLRHGKTPLLTVDVWEHAYYIDYRNRRGEYVDAILNALVDWRFVAANHADASRA